MGNKPSSSSSLITKNWQKINANTYKNILTSQLVKQTSINFFSQQELDSTFKKYVQRVNLSHLDIMKLVYFVKQNHCNSICTSNSNQFTLKVYTEFVQQTLDFFIDKFKKEYIQSKGDSCLCYSIVKAAIYLAEKYTFFKVNPQNIWIDIVQNKKNIKKYRAKLWINSDSSSCDVKCPSSQQQMIMSLKYLLKQKIVKNSFCVQIKHEEFQSKFRHFSSLKALLQKVMEAHDNKAKFQLNQRSFFENNRQHEQCQVKNVRSFSSNSFYPEKKKYNPNQSFGFVNRTNSTRAYQKKFLVETKLIPHVQISSLKNQTYIPGYNDQKLPKNEPVNCLAKFFSQGNKFTGNLNKNQNNYKQQVILNKGQSSYIPLIANNTQTQNQKNHSKNKSANIQFHFSNKQSQNTHKSYNSSFDSQNKKIYIKQFKTDEKTTDPTDRTKNQVSSKQEKQTNSVINSSRKNNCIVPNSLSSTYGASSFPPLKNQKQDFQTTNLNSQIPQKIQTQKMQKRHSSKDQSSMRQQQSSSSKTYSTKNIVINQAEEANLKKEMQINSKYEKYCNKLKLITQDKKIQSQMSSVQNSKIKQQPLNQHPLQNNNPIRKQSFKMAKSINVSSEMNESINNSKQNVNKNLPKNTNFLNKFTSIDQIQQRQSFNFDYQDIKQSKFIRTGSQEYVLNYPLKKKQLQNMKHNKQYSQIPYNISQSSQTPKMQKKHISLNLKDQIGNLIGSDKINNISYSYGYNETGPVLRFKNRTKQMIDSLSNNKSGINGQLNSVYNESVSNLSVHGDEQQNLRKSKRQKEIIKQEMQSLLRVTTSNQDDHSIKAKVKYKRQIFSQLKAEALKILD